MTERIIALKDLFLNGVDKELFLKLILHSTDGPVGFPSAILSILK